MPGRFFSPATGAQQYAFHHHAELALNKQHLQHQQVIRKHDWRPVKRGAVIDAQHDGRLLFAVRVTPASHQSTRPGTRSLT
ncbi:hypothetical protein BN439_3857 [Erwinia amylovora Ea644]|nr:hypothetical protein BN439_3857 [Erwinia amylovora Ea644]CCP08954.1 hypothetical protein BN440_3970 [Erwinia amylovora MR1]